MPRPRKGRGGPREGTGGKAYPQRTDLNRGTQPIRVARGQTYGEAGVQEASQQIVPLPQNRQVPLDQPGSGGLGQAQQAAADFEFPPTVPLGAPSADPNEPVTAGMDMGAGPGSEAIHMMPQATDAPSAKVLSYLASLPTATPQVKDLALRLGQQTPTPQVPQASRSTHEDPSTTDGLPDQEDPEAFQTPISPPPESRPLSGSPSAPDLAPPQTVEPLPEEVSPSEPEV